MAWYPDWVVALDDVAKGRPGAVVTQRNAQDIIRELEQLTRDLKAPDSPGAKLRAALRKSPV